MITIFSTIHEYLIYWNSPACTPCNSDRMRVDRARYIRKYYAPCLGSVCLNKYCQNHVYQLRHFLDDDPNTSEVMSFIVLRVFRQAMTHAKEHLFISDAYCDSLYLPYIMDSKVHIYTPDNIKAIFSAIEYELLCNYYKLIYFTGITSSEARALRLTDIDLDNRIIHIRQRILGKTRRTHNIEALQDHQRIRDIYLSDAALDCVKDELERHRIKISKPFWKDTGQNLLFTYRNGAPVTDSYLAQTKKVIEVITGIENFSTLSLRYTAADAALKAGASEKTLQDFLGFVSLRYIFRMKDKFIEGGTSWSLW